MPPEADPAQVVINTLAGQLELVSFHLVSLGSEQDPAGQSLACASGFPVHRD